MRYLFLISVLFLIIACKKNGTVTGPPRQQFVFPQCDTSSTSAYTIIGPFGLGGDTYTDIRTPYRRKYRMTTDSTCVYTWLTNSSPVTYDSVNLKMYYGLPSNFGFTHNGSPYNTAAFSIVCTGRGGNHMDTLFVAIYNPNREVYTLKRSN